MPDKAVSLARSRQEEHLAHLCELVRIPSISALPEHRQDMQAAAEWLGRRCTQAGAQRADVLSTAGHPLLYAEWRAGPNAPSVLIYGHYDVQPADPLEEWHAAPFEPVVRGDYLYGRGSSDDKGQLYTHIAAIESLLQAEGRLPVSVKLLVEGEEEVSSRHLEPFVAEHRDLLRANVALISDSAILGPEQPSIVYSVRGIAYLEVELTAFKHDLHSGGYGGAVDNPLNALVKILAGLKDDEGRITIPGFYDDVRELSAEERRAIAAIPFDEAAFAAEIGARALFGEAGYTTQERRKARPTLEIHGIPGGFTGEGPKTVIAARAAAKVSMRLVPDQHPEKIARLFVEHVRRLAPPTMDVAFRRLGDAHPAIIDIRQPAMAKAKEAYRRGFGREPLFVREGGTIPVVSMLQQQLKVPVVMMGFGLPDDNLHAPNERFYLPNFYRGIETVIHYLHLLGEG